MNFRQAARNSLQRARVEIASGDPERLKYAALELRFAMEAVTYDRALAFKGEIPPNEFRTWQPRKLMQVLHDIDPHIGLTSSIAVGVEDKPGQPVPPEKMRMLGTDKVFTLADLKEHYDAIGSVLHMPSLNQVDKGKLVDPSALRGRCETVASLLDHVLGSPVWNVTLGSFAEIECLRCGKPIRKRLPSGAVAVDARCFECGAEYVVKDDGPNKSRWEPSQEELTCRTAGCSAKFAIWKDEVKPGTWWTCSECGQSYVIGLSVHKKEPSA